MNEDRSRHLTSKEIARWLVEGPSQKNEEHLQSCWTCQAKLAEARDPLVAFRKGLVAWSEAQEATQLVPASPSRRFRLWLPAAGLAVAALLLAGFFGASALRDHRATPGGVARVTTVSDPDSVLMDQVDTEVSEAVPDAMAPLTDLVAWDGSETEPARVEAGKSAKPVSMNKAKALATD